MKTNALVMQSGGPTAVMNRSLYGLVDEAAGRAAFSKLLGADHGIEGLLAQELIDLGRTSSSEWARISRTPGAALGSTRRKLRSEDLPVLTETLARHSVGCLFIIGGNDSADTGLTMAVESCARGHDLSVIVVPKTIDNDLVETDHSPGYGSAARFVALATMGAGRDAEAMGRAAPITVIEVMGRDSGWLAASSALARRRDGDAPHLVCVPEAPVVEDDFLALVEDAYSRYGFAVAVIAENARGPHGVLGDQQEPWLVDDFGHPYYDGPARYLAGRIGNRLHVRVRYEKPGTIQRSFAAAVSRTDAEEAEAVGRAAVRHAIDGQTDVIVTLVRTDAETYGCSTGLAPLAEVAGKVKAMPEPYLDGANGFVTEAFLDYARPLIGSPLPRFGRITRKDR
jgi:6-phosphofructokinase 1